MFVLLLEGRWGGMVLVIVCLWLVYWAGRWGRCAYITARARVSDVTIMIVAKATTARTVSGSEETVDPSLQIIGTGTKQKKSTKGDGCKIT